MFDLEIQALLLLQLIKYTTHFIGRYIKHNTEHNQENQRTHSGWSCEGCGMPRNSFLAQQRRRNKKHPQPPKAQKIFSSYNILVIYIRHKKDSVLIKSMLHIQKYSKLICVFTRNISILICVFTFPFYYKSNSSVFSCLPN